MLTLMDLMNMMILTSRMAATNDIESSKFDMNKEVDSSDDFDVYLDLEVDGRNDSNLKEIMDSTIKHCVLLLLGMDDNELMSNNYCQDVHAGNMWTMNKDISFSS